MDGYVRVSRVGRRKEPSFISPSVQREAIEGWATRNGFGIDRLFEEMDESGSRPDRPLLDLAIRRVELGVSAGVVVWRVDRFGRSLADGVRAIDRIRAAGGGFWSVQDGLDINTDAGRLVLGILLSVGEYQLEGIRASWDAARQRAVRRGVWDPYFVPVGYRKTRTRRLLPDPQTGPLVTELFRRRASGASLVECCRFLEEHEIRTGKGNPGWCTTTMSHLLRSRVYLGEIVSGRYVKEDAHPPLTDHATWHAAHRPRTLRRYPRNEALLVGLVRCAACRHMLRPGFSRPNDTPYGTYTCRKHQPTGECPAPAIISASRLEPFALEALLRVLRTRRRTPERSLATAELLAQEAVDAFRRYRDNDRIAARLGEGGFLAGLAVRQDRVRKTALHVDDLRARCHTRALPPAAEVARAWPTMTTRERRELIMQAIDMFFVAKGRGPAATRVTVCPVGTAPRLLPRPGDKGRASIPIQARRGWLNPTQ